MIRWSYVIPRLVGIITLCLIVALCVPPLIRWGLIQSMEKSTGTEVEVANVWASLMRGEVCIGKCQMARRTTDSTNLLQFDAARMTIDVSAAAHRRCVIAEAQIRGLRFHAPRTTGELPASEPSAIENDIDQGLSEHARQARRATSEWLRQATAKLQHRVEDQFESIRLARQLAARWPANYRQLQLQARELQQRAQLLHQAFTTPPASTEVAERLLELQSRWSEVVQLRAQLGALHDHLNQLSAQLPADREAIEVALRDDQQMLQETMQLSTLDTQQLNELLLDGEVRQWWEQLRPWLELAHWLTVSPEANELGERGRLVPFDDPTSEPNFLIRVARLDGQLELAGQSVDFVGQARNVTLPGGRDTVAHVGPTQLSLVTRGPFQAHLHTQIERAEDAVRHQVIFRCDDLPVPGRKWGEDDGLAVTVAPSTLQIQALFVSHHEQIQGRLRVTQRDIQLDLLAPPDWVPDSLQAPLRCAAREVRQLDVWIDVAGTLETPTWQLRSNLGPQLQRQLQQAAERVLREELTRMSADAQQRVQRELAQLQQQLTDESDSLHRQLGRASELLSGLSEPVAAHLAPLGRVLRRF